MPEHIVVTFSWVGKTTTVKLAAHLDPQTVKTTKCDVLDDTIEIISQLTEIELAAKLPDILKQLIVP